MFVGKRTNGLYGFVDSIPHPFDGFFRDIVGVAFDAGFDADMASYNYNLVAKGFCDFDVVFKLTKRGVSVVDDDSAGIDPIRMEAFGECQAKIL